MDSLADVLVLWDVDHTLIENGGVSKKNYARAFRILTGNEPVKNPVTDGRTDIGIMRSLLESNHVSPDSFSWDDQRVALEKAGKENYSLLCEKGHAMKGAIEALEALANVAYQGVLTGNIEPNARRKLRAFNLEQYIDFRISACGVKEVRSDLVAVAQDKASVMRFDPEENATVIIGDTVLDVSAGRDGGARVVAVATGVSSIEELAAAGADEVLPDLADLERVRSALGRAASLGPVTGEERERRRTAPR